MNVGSVEGFGACFSTVSGSFSLTGKALKVKLLGYIINKKLITTSV